MELSNLINVIKINYLNMIDYDYDDVTILNRFEIYISFFLKLNYFNIESEL